MQVPPVWECRPTLTTTGPWTRWVIFTHSLEGLLPQQACDLPAPMPYVSFIRTGCECKGSVVAMRLSGASIPQLL